MKAVELVERLAAPKAAMSVAWMADLLASMTERLQAVWLADCSAVWWVAPMVEWRAV